MAACRKPPRRKERACGRPAAALRSRTVELRPASPADEGFIADLSAEAFAPFGDYRELLPRWAAIPGISVWVAEEERPVGFVMVGFYYGDPRRSWVYADMLAIAVIAGRRGRGVGRRLLRKAVEIARETALEVRELRLTVADTNDGAQRLFASEGFRLSDETHGRYDGGQLALRMRRPL